MAKQSGEIMVMGVSSTLGRILVVNVLSFNNKINHFFDKTIFRKFCVINVELKKPKNKF